MKKKAETKLEMIKAIETQYNQKKKQAEEKLAKKMQAIAKRIAIINQEKEKAQQEIAEKTKIKIRKHQNLKQQLKLVFLIKIIIHIYYIINLSIQKN